MPFDTGAAGTTQWQDRVDASYSCRGRLVVLMKERHGSMRPESRFAVDEGRRGVSSR